MAPAEEICEWPSTSLTGYEGRRFASAEALATQLDGVLQLDTHEEHLVHESFTADTRDHEDHTFCGIMFDVQCHTRLPAEYMEVNSVAVRGELGPMTVWTTPRSFEDGGAWHGHHHDFRQSKCENRNEWTLVYSADHEPSRDDYTTLRLTQPIRLAPGESCGIYVHSARPGDRGLVYDNQRASVTHSDRICRVLPGQAHLSCHPFGRRGFWGHAWRYHREFVGQVSYGVRWKLWSPHRHVHTAFPVGFRRAARTLLLGSRRPESWLYLLQDEVIFFILNRLRWDSFGAAMDEHDEATRARAALPQRVYSSWDGMDSDRDLDGDLGSAATTPRSDRSYCSLASNVTARRLARAQSRFHASLQAGAAAAEAAYRAAERRVESDDNDNEEEEDSDDEAERLRSQVVEAPDAALTQVASHPVELGGSPATEGGSLLDARIRELLATVGSGRIAVEAESDASSDVSGADGAG